MDEPQADGPDSHAASQGEDADPVDRRCSNDSDASASFDEVDYSDSGSDTCCEGPRRGGGSRKSGKPSTRKRTKRPGWTRSEEETLAELHCSVGNQWSLIAARLPGRTPNEVKNIWHSTHRSKHLKARSLLRAYALTLNGRWDDEAARQEAYKVAIRQDGGDGLEPSSKVANEAVAQADVSPNSQNLQHCTTPTIGTLSAAGISTARFAGNVPGASLSQLPAQRGTGMLPSTLPRLHPERHAFANSALKLDHQQSKNPGRKRHRGMFSPSSSHLKRTESLSTAVTTYHGVLLGPGVPIKQEFSGPTAAPQLLVTPKSYLPGLPGTVDNRDPPFAAAFGPQHLSGQHPTPAPTKGGYGNGPLQPDSSTCAGRPSAHSSFGPHMVPTQPGYASPFITPPASSPFVLFGGDGSDPSGAALTAAAPQPPRPPNPHPFVHHQQWQQRPSSWTAASMPAAPFPGFEPSWLRHQQQAPQQPNAQAAVQHNHQGPQAGAAHGEQQQPQSRKRSSCGLSLDAVPASGELFLGLDTQDSWLGGMEPGMMLVPHEDDSVTFGDQARLQESDAVHCSASRAITTGIPLAAMSEGGVGVAAAVAAMGPAILTGVGGSSVAGAAAGTAAPDSRGEAMTPSEPASGAWSTNGSEASASHLTATATPDAATQQPADGTQTNAAVAGQDQPSDHAESVDAMAVLVYCQEDPAGDTPEMDRTGGGGGAGVMEDDEIRPPDAPLMEAFQFGPDCEGGGGASPACAAPLHPREGCAAPALPYGFLTPPSAGNGLDPAGPRPSIASESTAAFGEAWPPGQKQVPVHPFGGFPHQPPQQVQAGQLQGRPHQVPPQRMAALRSGVHTLNGTMTMVPVQQPVPPAPQQPLPPAPQQPRHHRHPHHVSTPLPPHLLPPAVRTYRGYYYPYPQPEQHRGQHYFQESSSNFSQQQHMPSHQQQQHPTHYSQPLAQYQQGGNRQHVDHQQRPQAHHQQRPCQQPPYPYQPPEPPYVPQTQQQQPQKQPLQWEQQQMPTQFQHRRLQLRPTCAGVPPSCMTDVVTMGLDSVHDPQLLMCLVDM